MRYSVVLVFLAIICKAGAQSSALAVADSLYAVGNYTKALSTYESLPDKTAQIQLQIARSYSGKGNKTAALESYKASLTQNPEQPIAATEYGKMLITRSKFSVADTVFGQLTKKYPDNPEYFYQWGRALKQLQNKKDSLLVRNDGVKGYEYAFAKAVSLDSTHQKALFQLALFHLKESDYPIVEKLCLKALETDDENVEIINVLAQNFYNRGYYSEAVDWFEQLLTLGQRSVFIHEKLGYSYYQENMYTLAIEQYEILLESDDEDYATHLILAKLYNFQKNLDKATYHGEQALYFKDLPLDDVYMTMGATYRLHKQWEDAMEQFQNAIKENPNEGRAYHNLAICADNYYKDKKQVLQLYERFISKFKNKRKYQFNVRLAEERAKILKREIFMKGDGN